jgi:hypothetical protein
MIVLARMSGPRVLGLGSRVHFVALHVEEFHYHASLDKCHKSTQIPPQRCPSGIVYDLAY